MRESYKLIIPRLKALKLIEGSVAAIDSSTIYAEGTAQEGTGAVYDYLKKMLFEKYRHVGIKVLRRAVLRKNAIVYFKEEGFELAFNAKKAKEVYKEQIASITHFVETTREKMDALDGVSLLHYLSVFCAFRETRRCARPRHVTQVYHRSPVSNAHRVIAWLSSIGSHKVFVAIKSADSASGYEKKLTEIN